MSAKTRFLLSAIAALSLAGCSLVATPTGPWRQAGIAEPKIDLLKLEQEDERTGAGPQALRGVSWERFQANSRDGEFDLGIIELAEDGRFQDQEQRRRVIEKVKEKLKDGGTLITFVHGWHHDASPCDENLACFRRVLGLVSKDPRRSNRGPVVGLYIGWRGQLFKTADTLSFWDRKRVAHEIGRGDAVELLIDLHRYYVDVNARLKEQRDRWSAFPSASPQPGLFSMVTVGHSFGGALVFSAIERSLVRRSQGHLTVGPRNAQEPMKPIRDRFGSLVVLINPAFEAERYRTFQEDLEADGTYDDQCPSLVTFSSKGDWANRYAFPIGRTLWMLWHWNRWDNFWAEIKAQGQEGRQVTQDLIKVKGSNPRPRLSKAACGCPFSAEIDQVPEELGKSPGPAVAEERRPRCGRIRALHASKTTRLGDVEIHNLGQPGGDPSSPYLVMKTDSHLIRGHSQIYGSDFVAFLISYLNRYLDTETAPEATQPETPKLARGRGES